MAVAVVMDFEGATLEQYDEVWASAGTPTSVFALTPATLVSITNAEVADIT